MSTDAKAIDDGRIKGLTRIPRMTSNGHESKIVEKELCFTIIGGFYAVYNALGYGFLEANYANALSLELRRRGLAVQREVPVEVLYLGQPVGFYRMDMVVLRRVLIEIKSSAAVVAADKRQLLNYLRATDLNLGILLHFGPTPRYFRVVSPKLLG